MRKEDMSADESSNELDQQEKTEKDLEKLPESKPQSKNIDVPDGGYGWVVVGSVFLFNFSTWAPNSAYAIYLAHYLDEDTFPGGGKLDYAAIGGIAFGCGLLCGPLIRLVIRATSVHAVIVMGMTAQFLGLMLAAFSTKLWQVYLTQGVLIGFGLAGVCIPSITVLAQWFREKRSLAQAIAATGSGFGGVVYNLAIQQIIKSMSLRWALIIQAIMCASCIFVGLLALRTRTKQLQTVMRIWDNSLLKYPPYWWYALYISFTLLGYVVLLYNLADFTMSLGYSSRQGSIVSCMVSVGIIPGRTAIGKLSDKFGPITTSIIAHALVGIFCFAIWIPARNYSTAIGFALVQGALMGSIWVCIGAIGARVVGLRKLDVAMSMAWIFIGSFGMVSPIIGIQLRSDAPAGKTMDPTQYRNPAIYCGFCYIGSALALWTLRAILLVRDTEAQKYSTGHTDSDEMHIKVGIRECFGKFFAFSKTRSV